MIEMSTREMEKWKRGKEKGVLWLRMLKRM